MPNIYFKDALLIVIDVFNVLEQYNKPEDSLKYIFNLNTLTYRISSPEPQ
jgi:hypothetical protein